MFGSCSGALIPTAALDFNSGASMGIKSIRSHDEKQSGDTIWVADGCAEAYIDCTGVTLMARSAPKRLSMVVAEEPL